MVSTLLLPNQRIHSSTHPGLGTSFDISPCSCEIPRVGLGGREEGGGDLEAAFQRNTLGNTRWATILPLQGWNKSFHYSVPDLNSFISGDKNPISSGLGSVTLSLETGRENLLFLTLPSPSSSGLLRWGRVPPVSAITFTSPLLCVPVPFLLFLIRGGAK